VPALALPIKVMAALARRLVFKKLRRVRDISAPRLFTENY